jgi:signal transduction histidine kinase
MAPSTRMAPQRVDLLIVCGLIALSQVEVWHYRVAGGGIGAALTQAAVGCSLVWRRRHPLLAAAGVLASLFACAWVTGAEPGSATAVVATLLAFAGVGAMANRTGAVLGLLVALVLAIPMTSDHSLNTYLAIALTSFVVPWLLGALWLRRQLYLRSERDRDEAARRAVVQERRRLAWELHDVVSHNVGMMVVQAGAGDVLLEKDPDRVRDSLHAIERGGRETLVELRRLLGLLHSDENAPLASQPTLATLPLLAASLGEAGVEVTIRSEGTPRALPAGIDLTAYRIVQEALTNVLKHAAATRAEVGLRYASDLLEVEVSDNGHGAANLTSGGFGLAGIAERVALFGGELETSNAAPVGFTIRARLPLAAT